MEDIFTPETSSTLSQARSKRAGRAWAIALGSLLAVAVAATAITLGVVYGTKKKNPNGGGGGGGGNQKPTYSDQIACSGGSLAIVATAYGSGTLSVKNPALLTYSCSTSPASITAINSNPNHRNGLYLFTFQNPSGSGNLTMIGQYYDSGDPNDVSSFVNNLPEEASSASFYVILTDGDASPFLTNSAVVNFLQETGSTFLTSTSSYSAGWAYCVLVDGNVKNEDLIPTGPSATAVNLAMTVALNRQ